MAQLPTKYVVLLTAFAVVGPVPAAAQAPIIPGAPAGQWPKTLEPKTLEPKSPDPAMVVPGPTAGNAEAALQPWTQAEIEAARAHCTAVLAQHNAEAVQLEPIKEGACGSPAAVQLTSIGNSPRVTLSQPAVINCEMVAVLGDWLKGDVQPAARKLLGAKIVRIDVLSSYSCRTAYGRKKTRMSEHGRANAIDIKAFHTDREQAINLLADWGMTERDVQARIAAAEAAARAQAIAQQAQAEADARARALAGRGGTGRQQGTAGVQNTDEQAIKGFVAGTIGRAVRGPASDLPSTLTLEQPARLGGPKAKKDAGAAPAQATAAPAVPDAMGAHSGRAAFLRHLHDTGCRRFATALGPEANDAHRNHFHFDMAERNGGKYCR